MLTLYLRYLTDHIDDLELIKSLYHVTPGNSYEGELCPVITNPNTLQPESPAYVIKCDDGKFRKMYAEHFIPLEEWREKQLNELEL